MKIPSRREFVEIESVKEPFGKREMSLGNFWKFVGNFPQLFHLPRASNFGWRLEENTKLVYTNTFPGSRKVFFKARNGIVGER